MKHKLQLIRVTLTLAFAAILVLRGTDAVAQPARNPQISLSRQELKVKQLFVEVYEQTGIGMAFNARQFDGKRIVSFSSKNLSLSEALSQALAGTGFTYTLNGKTIIVEPVSAATAQASVNVTTLAPAPERYRQNNPDAVEKAWSERPAEEVGDSVTEQPAQSVTQEPAQELPAPYSTYTDPDLYARAQGKLPRWAIKTNLLYTGAALTPNLAFEVGLSPKSTLELSVSLNQWNYEGNRDNNKKLNHMTIRPEYRWWLCERYDGHSFGAHAFYSIYNISGHDIPILFDKEYRYEGYAIGAGISYGYHWAFAKRWGLEFNVGVGMAHLKYKRFGCTMCDKIVDEPSKTYFGPTRAGISLVFMIK